MRAWIIVLRVKSKIIINVRPSFLHMHTHTHTHTHTERTCSIGESSGASLRGASLGVSGSGRVEGSGESSGRGSSASSYAGGTTTNRPRWP